MSHKRILLEAEKRGIPRFRRTEPAPTCYSCRWFVQQFDTNLSACGKHGLTFGRGAYGLEAAMNFVCDDFELNIWKGD